MIRPKIVSFSVINSDNRIFIQSQLCQLKLKKNSSIPVKSIGLLSKRQFRVSVIGKNKTGKTIYQREFDTDYFGNLQVDIPAIIKDDKILSLIIYETSVLPGYEFNLGSFIPMKIKSPKKFIVADFDKTLVDTKYSTIKEVYHSLFKPLSYFPEIKASTKLLKEYINNGYQPFILSASPHFYEDAIRHWLVSKQIFAHQVHLKDYRNFFSFSEGPLLKKDIKNQGFYKLNKLLSILSISGIPDELVLMGDGFESDMFIYLSLYALLKTDISPWQLWDSIKTDHRFLLTEKQSTHFLTSFNYIKELSKKSDPDIKIHIRATKSNLKKLENVSFNHSSINELKHHLRFYVG